MTKISSISIYGFRGIRNQVKFDFGKSQKSLVISAENGRGKSSVTDSIEWYFQGAISHLQKEGCFESAYRHYRLPTNESSVVSIAMADADVFGEKHLELVADNSGLEKQKTNWKNKGAKLDNFLEISQGENIILRHAQLKDFVSKTKGEKLKAVSSIIGFDVVTQARDTINKVRGSIEKDRDYQMVIGQIKEKERDISVLVAPFSGAVLEFQSEIFATAEQLRNKLGWQTVINDFDSFQKISDEINNNPTSDEKGKYFQFLINLESILPQSTISSGFVKRAQEYSVKQKELWEKKENLEKLVLIELYQAGTYILEQNPNLERCPLCENEIDGQYLLNNLQAKSLELAEIKKEADELKVLADDVTKRIATIIDNLETARRALESNTNKLKENPNWLSLCQETIKILSLWAEATVKSGELTGEFILIDEDLKSLQAYNTETIRVVNEVKTEIKNISESDTDRQQDLQKQTLQNLFAQYSRWIELKSIEKRFRQQIKSLENIVQLLEKREREGFYQALTAISDEVNDFYKALHPEEGFDQLKLIPTPDRGLEFEFSFKGDRITPPNKLMSESHLNTLGLCFFLASAVEFNKNCQFIVLDDVVSSVDANHRQSFAKLLRDDHRLNQKQYIILSHDMFWSDILHRMFPKWLHKKIQNWDYDSGISLEDKVELRGQVNNALQHGDTIDAARRTRDLVDTAFRGICEDYNIAMPYRQGSNNEKRELNEFVGAIAQHFGANNRFDAAQPPLSDIHNCLWLMNIASHPDPRQLNLTINDVRMILSDLDAFVALFYNHTSNCKHKQKKLIWDKATMAFQPCATCNHPI